MKKLFFFAAVFSVFAFTLADPITEQERTDLLKYYAFSDSAIQAEVTGLSEAQLNWKPNDSTWSVANCLEHITLAEQGIYGWFQQTMQAPADPSKKKDVKVTDDQLKQMIESRQQKFKAPTEIQPTNKFSSVKITLDTFATHRAGIVKYIQETQVPLRDHVAETPAGTIDGYQFLLFLNAHTRRHTAQIVEVKSLPGFPKN